MNRLYALLVGIDAYQPPLGALTGCCNDVAEMHRCLTRRVATEQLSLTTLLNEQATRQGIITAFRTHLGQAGPGDTALFFYAGHGSRELTPELYRYLDPDGFEETLVAYDSRLPGGWDIADKELHVLVAELALRAPHVVIILDSCHSGSATLQSDDSPTRRAPRVSRNRPPDTFWFFSSDAVIPPDLASSNGWRMLPHGRHVMLTACHANQKAKEITRPESGNRCGVFSYFLIQALDQLSRDISYRDLYKWVQALVAHTVEDQVPQAEGDLEGSLFDGKILKRPSIFYIRNLRNRGWRLDAGQVHAIQEGMELAIFPLGAVADLNAGSRIATVKVSKVGAVESIVHVKTGQLPASAGALPAVIISMPFSTLSLSLSGVASEELQQRIAESPYLRVVDRSLAEIMLEAGREELRLKRRDSPQDLAPAYLADTNGVCRVVEALEKIARWQAISGLSNSCDGLGGALRMTVFEWYGPPACPGAYPEVKPLPEDQEILLPYRQGEPVRFTAHIENRSPRAFSFSLLVLTTDFGIKILEDAKGRLPGGEAIWVRPVDGIAAIVPDCFFTRGVTRSRNILLLLICDQEADIQLLEQKGLFAYEEPGWSDSLLTSVSQIIYQPSCREADVEPVAATRWSAQVKVIIAERPAPAR
jgi:hypothetical protein